MSSVLQQITVTILTKNSEKYLIQCLESLRLFGEVLILDNGSTDRTLELATVYENVTIEEHDFIGFGPLKNLAIEKAQNEWIFSVDSDEVVSKDLLSSIKGIDLVQKSKVYAVSRLNHYNGKPVRCCGWYPDIVMRLFNRRHTCFDNALIHESLLIKTDTDTEALNGALNHYPFDTIAGLIAKMQNYSTLYAKQHTKKSSLSKAFFRALFSFFKNYFLQKGLFCGYEGLVISVSNANGVFYKYMKLYEKQLGER